jgi:K(+)-stimulated pyrophosphate-energized sodium pump
MFYMLFALAAGGWALRVAGRRARWIREQDAGTERMREIARATQAGAMAFLSREYRALGVFVGVVTALLFVGGLLSEDSSFLVAVSFVVGAGCAAMAGYSGLRVATDADVRTANAARASLAAALHVAFAGGAVAGWWSPGSASAGSPRCSSSTRCCSATRRCGSCTP